MFSGLRVGELVGPAVADVDSERCEVTISHLTAKGEKARVVPCVTDVRAALAAYLYSRPAHAEALLLAPMAISARLASYRPKACGRC